MDVSVLLATFKRDNMLRETLASFEALDVEGLNWEIVVVDNAVDDKTESTAMEFQTRLPIRLLTEARRGKNFALNAGLEVVSGDLVVLTDDDIRADPGWLKGLWRARQRYPDIAMFAGKILPEFPDSGPRIELPDELYKSVFVVNDFGSDEKPIPAERVWGGNMAIVGHIFTEGNRFDTTIGPSGGQYAMGSEVEFTIRMERCGHRAFCVPDALVWHRIREEQLTVEWLEGRLFRLGRGHVALNGRPPGIRWFGVPRHVFREIAELTGQSWMARLKSDGKAYLRARLLRSFARGVAHQCKVASGDR